MHCVGKVIRIGTGEATNKDTFILNWFHKIVSYKKKPFMKLSTIQICDK